jgi:hypothetical protein
MDRVIEVLWQRNLFSLANINNPESGLLRAVHNNQFPDFIRSEQESVFFCYGPPLIMVLQPRHCPAMSIGILENDTSEPKKNHALVDPQWLCGLVVK